ncbi:MAG: hypothetical protein D0531_12130 [Methylococcales bacterium]|nr:MAG: hypothetical protein D0531_12130 [Methylococcales bacterium]
MRPCIKAIQLNTLPSTSTINLTGLTIIKTAFQVKALFFDIHTRFFNTHPAGFNAKTALLDT